MPGQIVVATDTFGAYKVQLSAQTQIWKGEWDTKATIEPGDDVTIGGKVDHKAKTAKAGQIWVNIAALSGKISNIKRNANGMEFTVYDVRYGTLLVMVAPKQKVMPPNTTQEVSLDEISWEKIKFVDIVGLKLKEKLVKASSVSVSYE